MTGGGSTTCQQQLQRHRPADDVGCPDYYRMQTMRFYTGRFNQGHDAFGRTGAQCRDTLCQPTHVVGMETIHVLVGANTLQYLSRIAVSRQGELHQNTVNVCVFIQLIDQCQQLFWLAVASRS